MFPKVLVKCPTCENKIKLGDLGLRGWTEPRIIYGEDDLIFAYFRIYSCKSINCSKRLYSNEDYFLSELPFYVKSIFPFVLSKKNGITQTLLNRLIQGLECSTGIAAFRKMIKETYRLKYETRQLDYYSALKSFLKLQKDSASLESLIGFKLSDEELRTMERFSSFEDTSGYFGRIPSETFLKGILIREIEKKEGYLRKEMQRRCGQFLFLDHSHKVTKHIQHFGDTKLYNGLLTGLNEFQEIRVLQFVQSTSFQEIGQSLKNFYNTSHDYGIEPKYVWIDNCCSERKVLCDYLPSLNNYDEILVPLPLPTVHHISDPSQVNICLDYLISFVYQLREGEHILIGLDTEWPVVFLPVYHRGKIAVIQISVSIPHPTVYVFQTSSWETAPNSLKYLLQSNQVKKAGNRIISSDVKYLKDDWGIYIDESSCIPLNHLAKDKGVFGSSHTSLESMCKKVLKYDLPKPQGIRLSNWKAGRLSKEQIEYAARDAHASLLIAEKLNSMNSFQLTVETSSSTISGTSTERGFHDNRLLQSASSNIGSVRLDAFHAMKRISDVISTKNPFSALFMGKLRDAIFEINATDKEKVTQVLAKSGKSFESTLLQKPDWIFQRVRRLIPTPEILKQRIESVITEFSHQKYTHHRHGILLNEKAKKELKTLLSDHVSKGCLSDPPGVSLYFKNGEDSDNLQIYRCIRGTNTVELWHQYIEMRFGSWNAGPRFANAAMLVLADRRNKRASVRYRANFPDFGHYEHYLIDDLNQIYFDLFKERLFLWWKDSKRSILTEETFGMVPSLPLHLQEIVREEDVSQYPDSMKFIAMKTRCKVPAIGISNVTEKKLFMKAVKFYLLPNKAGIDSIQMCNDWNFGTLKTTSVNGLVCPVNVPIGTNQIWRKDPRHLDAYYKTYSVAVERRQVYLLHDSISNLQQSSNDDETEVEFEFLEAAEPAPLPSNELYPQDDSVVFVSEFIVEQPSISENSENVNI